MASGNRTYSFERIGSGFIVDIVDQWHSGFNRRDALSRDQAVRQLELLVEEIKRDLGDTYIGKQFTLEVKWDWNDRGEPEPPEVDD